MHHRVLTSAVHFGGTDQTGCCDRCSCRVFGPHRNRLCCHQGTVHWIFKFFLSIYFVSTILFGVFWSRKSHFSRIPRLQDEKILPGYLGRLLCCIRTVVLGRSRKVQICYQISPLWWENGFESYQQRNRHQVPVRSNSGWEEVR